MCGSSVRMTLFALLTSVPLAKTKSFFSFRLFCQIILGPSPLPHSRPHYDLLKEKYYTKPQFKLINGDGWKMLGLEVSDSEVNLYIPNIPLSKDLRLR